MRHYEFTRHPYSLLLGEILPLGVTKISKSLQAGLDRLYRQ
jgi:hypothetical protein